MHFRSLALLALFTAVGCASPQGDEDGTTSADVTSPKTCAVTYEDDEIVAFANHEYAPKQLHVTEVRITPASPSWLRPTPSHVRRRRARRRRPRS